MARPARNVLEQPNPGAPFLVWLTAALFVALALVPDEKLVRLKLLVFELGLFSFVLLWALRGVWRARLEISLPLPLWGVAAWAAYVGLRAACSDYPALAEGELRRVLLCLAAFWASAQAALQPRGREILWRAWGVGTALVSLYGVLQRSGGVGRLAVPSMERVMGSFGNPIFFGAYLAVSIPLLWALCRETKGRERIFWSVSLGLALAALYLTRTRAAWIGLAVGLGSAVFLSWKRKKYAAVVLLFLVAAGGLFVSRTKSVWLRDQAHLLIWRDTLKLWLAHPAAGVGPGEFHIHFPSVAGPDLKAKWPPNQFIVNYAHNEFLQVLSETGVLGLGLWLGLFALFYRPFFSRRDSGKDGTPVPPKETALFCAVTAGLVQSFFSVDPRFSVSAGTLFFLLGQSVPPAGVPVKETSWNSTLVRKLAATAVLLWVSGVVAVERPGAGWGVNLGGFYQLRNAAGRPKGSVFPEEMRAGFLTRLLHPYAAQRRRASAPDFFDERLLHPEQTIADLEALGRRYPSEPAVFEKLGYAYAKEMRTRGADGRPVLRPEMADKAVKAYQRAAELDPARAGVYNNLGNIFYTRGDQRRAMEQWAKAVQADPNQLDVRLNLGKVYYLNGRLKEAVEQFRKVLELQPGNDEATVYLKKMVE
ncbi:MAG TPA: tetratricopeptide repeat protein [Elusimicrobiota bacterium]|nr:tetratricopeptide repeat protein [Elusimicrobiota bacterium]